MLISLWLLGVRELPLPFFLQPPNISSQTINITLITDFSNFGRWICWLGVAHRYHFIFLDFYSQSSFLWNKCGHSLPVVCMCKGEIKPMKYLNSPQIPDFIYKSTGANVYSNRPFMNRTKKEKRTKIRPSGLPFRTGNKREWFPWPTRLELCLHTCLWSRSAFPGPWTPGSPPYLIASRRNPQNCRKHRGQQSAQREKEKY